MRFVVLGGGCYGTFYATQLIRAADAGAIPRPEVVVVDHGAHPRAAGSLGNDARVRIVRAEWEPFLAAHLAALDPNTDDQIVPPPFTPHLALSWLLEELRKVGPRVSWEIEPFRLLPTTPYARQADNGTLTASHADWICPVHCIEPEVCPKTRGPRDWDMAQTARQLARSLEAHGQTVQQVHLLQCLHFTHGVGTYPAAALLSALQQMKNVVPKKDAPIRALVGTVSRCHGAMHLLKGHLGMDTVSPPETYARGTIDE